MQSSKLYIALGILLLATTAARADRVTFDYDHGVNFAKFKTYMWIQEPQTTDPFMKDRIMKAVNSQMTMRGLTQVSEGADLAIGANLATEERHTWETYYSGSDWGWGGGWGGGPSWATTTEKTYEVGTLTVDLFDAHNEKLAWQGVATDEVSHRPEKRTREIDKQIGKMFRGFPPITFSR